MTINHHREGSGPPLVLLHGIGLRWQICKPVLGRLASEYDVIACDSPGFGDSPPLAEVIVKEPKPGPGIQDRAELEADLRRRLMLIYHPVGTARMSDSAELAVVDSKLRVHGLQGLRVVDASVMPTIVGGNTNAPTIMIAEKAAAEIRAA